MGAGPAAGSGQRSMAAPGSDAPSKETRGQAPPPADVTRPASLPPARHGGSRRGTGSAAPGTAAPGPGTARGGAAPRAAQPPRPAGTSPVAPHRSPGSGPRHAGRCGHHTCTLSPRESGTASLISDQVELLKAIMSLGFGLAKALLSSKVSAPGGSQDEQQGAGRTWQGCVCCAGSAGLCHRHTEPHSKVWLLSLVVRNPPGKGIFPPAHSIFFQLTMSC